MIQLYNQHLQQFINIKDGSSFNFQAESQLVNLESYTIGFSFELELINNDAVQDAIKNPVYATGEVRREWVEPILNYPGYWLEIPITKANNLILVVNGVKLYSGRIIVLETTPNIVKVSYQAFPYSKVFENFIFKNTLKQYFDGRASGVSRLSQVFEEGAFLQALYSKNGYYVKVNTYNNTEDLNDFKKNWIWSNYSVLFADGRSSDERMRHPFQWCSFFVNDIIKAIGINIPEAIEEKTKEYQLFIPLKLSQNRTYRFTFTKEPKAIKSGNKYRVNYIIELNSPIQVYDEEAGVWYELTHSESEYFKVYHFIDTLKANKSISNSTIERIDLKGYQYGINALQLSGSKNDTSGLLNLYEGQTWDKSFENLDAHIGFYADNQSEADLVLYNLPDSIDIDFKLEFSFNYEEYKGDEKYNNNGFGHVPYFSYDFSFFEMSTNDFLSQLSLMCKDYNWLRNPMFVTPYNSVDVYNQKYPSTSICILEDSDVAELKKTIESDANNQIQVNILNGQEIHVTKQLNNLLTEPKKYEPEIVSLSYTNKYLLNTQDEKLHYSTLPIIEDKDGKILEHSLKGVVGKLELSSDEKARPVYNVISYSSDCDFLDTYGDLSEKYVFKVKNYKFEEEIVFEGRYFIVSKYSTQDFVTWELEAFQIVH